MHLFAHLKPVLAFSSARHAAPPRIADRADPKEGHDGEEEGAETFGNVRTGITCAITSRYCEPDRFAGCRLDLSSDRPSLDRSRARIKRESQRRSSQESDSSYE